MEEYEGSGLVGGEFIDPRPVELDRDEIIQQLHGLDRKDLRRVAWEALLMSDGPDKIEGDVEDSVIAVEVFREGFNVYDRSIGWGRDTDLRERSAK